MGELSLISSGWPLPSWRFLNPSPLHTNLPRSSPSWHTGPCMSWPNIICPTVSLMTSGIFVSASYAESCLLASGISSTSNAFCLLYPFLLKTLWYQDLTILTLPPQNSTFNLNLWIHRFSLFHVICCFAYTTYNQMLQVFHTSRIILIIYIKIICSSAYVVEHISFLPWYFQKSLGNVYKIQKFPWLSFAVLKLGHSGCLSHVVSCSSWLLLCDMAAFSGLLHPKAQTCFTPRETMNKGCWC